MQWRYWGRWALVLPAAVGALLAVSLAFGLMMLVTGFLSGGRGPTPGEFLYKVSVDIFGAIVASYCAVHVGTKVAPSHQRAAGLGIGVVLALVVLAGSVPAVMRQQWWTLATGASLLVGLVWGIQGVREDYPARQVEPVVEFTPEDTSDLEAMLAERPPPALQPKPPHP
jgi:hypothetical protein